MYNHESDEINKKQKGENTSQAQNDWVYLTNVENDIEFEMTAGLLRTADIPVIRKVRGTDGFFQHVFGVPIAGIQLIVPRDRYEEALELINTRVDDKTIKEEELKTEKGKDKKNKN